MNTCIKSSNFRLPVVKIFAIFLLFTIASCDEENFEESNKNETENEELTKVVYVTPSLTSNSYFFEPFDDEVIFEKKWIRSMAKKDATDESVAKYDGIWSLEPLEENSLLGDKGLILKSKAKHSAISAKLNKPFIFNTKPFIVQYEVNHQHGQECGGAYIKLLSDETSIDLTKFNDKTPYSIMFGPDKCGNEHRLHFIFRHVHPITKAIEEKHCKRPNEKLEAIFKDKKTHLYTLVIHPDSSFEVLLNHQVINSGHLLEDFTPPVNPLKEINDPNDVRPSDWDDREKISDPNVAKPADWDENAPRQIVDQFAEKPDGWLVEESDLIPDPEAVKPADWDDDMDGEWEAPLVPNPKCAEAPGCGKWKAPMIDNPNYKGKWKASLLDNPNYKGKWAPRKIHNPDFFEDLEPFKMTSIGALGIELWSMSDGIYFDNFLITDSIEEAQRISAETFDVKMAKLDNFQKSFFTRIIEFSNSHPWIYGVYVLVLAIPVVLLFVCCCAEDVKTDKDALRKKTDEPEEDEEEEVQEKKIDSEDQGEIVNEVQEEDEDQKADDDFEDQKDDDDFEDQKAEDDFEDQKAEDDFEDQKAEDDFEDQKAADDFEDQKAEDDFEDHKAEDDFPVSKSDSEVEKSDADSRKSSPRLRKIRKE